MAGILHANSIIADSTASSSPSRPNPEKQEENDASDLVEAQTKVRRVGRTYGRPKASVDVENVTNDNYGSRARLLRTAPHDADEQVIPESDDATDNAPNFTGFAWRAQLKAIDEGFDVSGDTPATTQLATLSGMTESYDASTTRQEVGEADETRSPAKSGSLFDGTLSSLLSSAPAPQSFFLNGSASPNKNEATASSAGPHRAARKRVADSPAASDSDNTSPQHPYPINSPKRQSSITPPTSPLGGLALQEVTASGEESTESATKFKKKGKATKKIVNKGKAIERKTKPLTKKEIVEMQKESARLLADRHVCIQREDTQSTYTIASLFNKLKHAPRQNPDPITSFSSPGNIFQASSGNSSSDASSPPKSATCEITASSSKLRAVTYPVRISSSQTDKDEEAGDDEADEDMPDPATLLRDDEEKRLKQVQDQEDRAEVEMRAKELAERKRKALEVAKLQSASKNTSSRARGKLLGDSDTDDDLEVEGLVGGQTLKPAVRRKSILVSQKSLELAAKPTFITENKSNRTRGQRASISQKDLNDLLLQRADRQGGVIEGKKIEEWVKAGGILKKQRQPDIQGRSMVDWLQKGSTRENAMEIDEGNEGEDEDEDEDEDRDPQYEPDVDDHEHEESDGEVSEMEVRDDKPHSPRHMDISDEDADTDKENHRPFPRRQRPRAIVDSDEEHETAIRATPCSPVVLAPDTSFAEEVQDSPGGDKENSAELAFSVSENKENEGVPRHRERGRVIDRDEQSHTVWPSSSPTLGVGGSVTGRKPLSRLDAEEEVAFIHHAVSERRDASQDRVLQVLHEEDQATTLARSNSAQKTVIQRRASTTSSSETEDMEKIRLASPIAFSQLYVEGEASEEPAPNSALGEGRFSQFFSQGNNDSNSLETPLRGKPSSRSAQQQSRVEQRSIDEDFEFTQPNALLPSVRISESQRREIDEMFGKDQEFKLDEAKRSRDQSQLESANTSNTLYFGSFVPSQQTQLSPQSIRRPLETLSLESRGTYSPLDDSPQVQPAQRRRLLRERPQQLSVSTPSESPEPHPRNAFDVLRDAAAKGKQREHPPNQALEKSEYIGAEAQESDEEAMFGFGGAKGDDEEEGGDEDPDAIVEGLVDDAVLGQKAQAADLVLEKHMEHQAADDAALQKIHQDAVDGKLRGKRRDRGIGFEDSDSDEEELRGSRKPLYKKRRVDGDTLDSYAENPETRAFYNAYQADLAEDDDPALAYLKQQDTSSMQEEVPDESDEEPTEVIDPAEIRRQLAEISRQGSHSTKPELNIESVSWLEQEDQEMTDLGNIQVEDGPLRLRKDGTTSKSMLDHIDYQGAFQNKKAGDGEQMQLKAWASQESRTHSLASGRGGFSRKDDTGSKSRKATKIAPVKGPTAGTERILTKSSSLISHVEKRKGFDA